MDMSVVVYSQQFLSHKSNLVFSMFTLKLSLIIDSRMKRFMHQAKFNMLSIDVSEDLEKMC